MQISRKQILKDGVFTERRRPLSAASLGLDTHGIINAWETWLEMPVGEKKEWIAACRIEAQEGTPVITELRIFPNETGEFLPGKWSQDDPDVYLTEPLHSSARIAAAERLQVFYENLKSAQGMVTPHIPRGGITTRLLRKVQLSHAQQIHRVTSPLFLKLGPKPKAPAPVFTKPAPRRGRPGKPDSYYAQIAKDYADAVKANSMRPVADIAERRKLSQAKVRDMVARARRLGFLSPNVIPGTRGGELTERAKALLGLKQAREMKSRGKGTHDVRYYPIAKKA